MKWGQGGRETKIGNGWMEIYVCECFIHFFFNKKLVMMNWKLRMTKTLCNTISWHWNDIGRNALWSEIFLSYVNVLLIFFNKKWCIEKDDKDLMYHHLMTLKWYRKKTHDDKKFFIVCECIHFFKKKWCIGKDDKDHVPPSHDIEMILEA